MQNEIIDLKGELTKMDKIKKLFVLLLIVMVASLGLVGCKKNHEHPTGDHPTKKTDEHPNKEHPNSEHPNSEHPKSEHPAGEHPK
jgi:hypothetical protein